jgi:hypothetical protein
MEGQVDRRINELKESKFNKQFDKYDANIKWVIGFSLSVNGCVLALLVKVFFFGPLE